MALPAELTVCYLFAVRCPRGLRELLLFRGSIHFAFAGCEHNVFSLKRQTVNYDLHKDQVHAWAAIL